MDEGTRNPKPCPRLGCMLPAGHRGDCQVFDGSSGSRAIAPQSAPSAAVENDQPKENAMPETKKRYLKLAYCGASYVVPVEDGDAILDEMQGREPDDVYELSVVELTDAEYEALGEFDGF